MFQTLKKIFSRPPQALPVQAAKANLSAVLEQGNAALANGQLELARQCFEETIRLEPKSADAYAKLATLHALQGQWREAESRLRQSLSCAPAHPQSLLLMAEVAGQGQDPGLRKVWLEEAVSRLGKFLTQAPDDLDAHKARGFALWQLKRLPEAEQHFHHLLEHGAGSLDNWNAHGQLLWEQGRFDAAATSLEQALRLNPDHVDSLILLGMVYHQGQKRFSAAEALLRRAVALAPGLPMAKLNLGLVLLCQGRLSEGWAPYEARLELSSATRAKLVGLAPWRGEPLTGKRLLVCHEQGFGDTIQFCRYLPLLKQQGVAEICLQVPAPLLPLMASLAGVDRLCAELTAEELARHDFWIHPLSLPGLFATDLHHIPAALPYLSPPAASQAPWQKRLPAAGLKIGIVWRGSASHSNDSQRSLPGLGSLAPLWQVPGLSWISLQKGTGEDEALAPPDSQPLIPLGQEVADFGQLAALVNQLDLLISVDTAVVHLAGALGKPCWVMLPYVDTDWRWLADRDDSPWYPGVMRLFRQAIPGDWSGVVTHIAEQLADWARHKPGQR